MSADDKKHYSEFTDTDIEEIKALANDIHDKIIRLTYIVGHFERVHDAHVNWTHATASNLLNVMCGSISPMTSSTLALAEQIKKMRDNK